MGRNRGREGVRYECAAERQEARSGLGKCPGVGWDAGGERGTRSGHSTR